VSDHPTFPVGSRVRRNPATWRPQPEFDAWGRGRGIGTVVGPPFDLEEGMLDVRWPGGRCFERADGLVRVP
jgi:hypothetical protein